MQFHPTGTDPTPNALLVCRNVRWNLVVILGFVWAAPVLLWLAEMPIWGVGFAAAVPALVTWPILGAWRKRGRRDNWVLALYRDGIWLNLRDCEYYEAEPAESVVFVSYGEIAAARRYIHRYTTPSSDGGDTLHKDIHLELELATPDTGELRLVLDEERRRAPPPRSYFGGFITSSTNRTQAPIEVEGNRAIRIKFTVSNYGLRPTLKKVLATLQGFVIVDDDKAPIRAEWEQLEGDEFNDLVRRLVKNGDRIDAIALLRSRKGMSTTEASQFVDTLEEPAAH